MISAKCRRARDIGRPLLFVGAHFRARACISLELPKLDTTRNLFCLSYRYVAWQVHERVEGHYDFEGDNDLMNFTQTAGSLGLLVIIRAGKVTLLLVICRSIVRGRQIKSSSVQKLYLCVREQNRGYYHLFIGVT